MLRYYIFFFFIIFYTNAISQDEYFLTLRNEKVNLRLGPSFDHPIKIFYNKKFLPVLIQEKSFNFRKIRDHENNTGWIHISQLSKKKAAIVIDEEVILFSNSTIYSKPVARLEQGRLTIVKKCSEDWCKVNVENFSGWIKKESLWGRL